MAYLDNVRDIVTARADEIRSDLGNARSQLRAARARVTELEGAVATFESLLSLAASNPDAFEDSGLTLHDAMVTVLRADSLHMLRAGDLAGEINRRGLYRMRDGRPVEAQQIHARVGHYGHLFKKEGTFIQLKDEAL